MDGVSLVFGLIVAAVVGVLIGRDADPGNEWYWLGSLCILDMHSCSPNIPCSSKATP